MSVSIIFETHSLSEDNERGVATGWLDGRLSRKGRQLARELGKRRRDDNVSAVFTSDLGRARETAMLAFGGSGIPVIEDARLRECNYGDLNGTSAEHIGVLRVQHIDVPYPSGQSYRQVVEQVRELLRDVAKSHSGKRVVFIGHSATKWALDHLLEGRDLHEAIEAPFNWQEGWHYELSTDVFQDTTA